jgi:ubiquinone/menaquinone biosynthesis C-methylase UbiE
MADHLAMAAHLAGQALRVGWYYGLTGLMEGRAATAGARTAYQPKRPAPRFPDLLAELGRQLLADAALVRDGLLPPLRDEGRRPLDHMDRVLAMLADLPEAVRRREAGDALGARTLPEAAGLPDYYTRDFHFQTDGYLSRRSARLYDVQLETLFFGAGALMRRAALEPLARLVAGRDQRRLSLLDVACGTGHFLRYLRLAWPALPLTGLDLSKAYLEEAEAHLGGLRPVTWIEGNAERLPFADAERDIVTCIFLFHELPPEVRRTVAREMARVLRPGGHLVFVDSLQMGDRPGWDGLLEAFPVRFHEPYYRHYAIDDLAGLFRESGLVVLETRLAFLAKVMVLQKPVTARRPVATSAVDQQMA